MFSNCFTKHPEVDGLTIINREDNWHTAKAIAMAVRKTLNAVHPFDLSEKESNHHLKSAMNIYCSDPRGGHWSKGWLVERATHMGADVFGVMPAADYLHHHTSAIPWNASAVAIHGMYRVYVVARFHDIKRARWTDGTMKTHPVSPAAGPGYQLVVEKFYSSAVRCPLLNLWVPQDQALSEWDESYQ